VFTEKIEKMLEKFLNRSSWILFCCLRLEEKKNCLEKLAKCYIIVTLFIFSFHKNIKMPSKRKKSHNLKQPADPLGKKKFHSTPLSGLMLFFFSIQMTSCERTCIWPSMPSQPTS
jgi:hypothetical protein